MTKSSDEKLLIEIFNRLRIEVGDGITLALNKNKFKLEVWHEPIEWTDEARNIIKQYDIKVVNKKEAQP